MTKYPLGTLVKIKDNFSGGISWSAGFLGIIISYNDLTNNDVMKDHYIIHLFRSKDSYFPSITRVYADHHEIEFIG